MRNLLREILGSILAQLEGILDHLEGGLDYLERDLEYFGHLFDSLADASAGFLSAQIYYRIHTLSVY